MSARLGAALLALALAPAIAGAQGLADRVSAAGTATVRFAYATRPDVEICDDDIHIGSQDVGSRREGRWHGTNCRDGPALVELDVRDGRVRRVEIVRRPADRTRGALDLGEVPAPAAARYLLGLGRTVPGEAGTNAVFAAVLADVDGLWRELLALARDRGAPAGPRKSALFWVGQEAADSVTRGLAAVAADDDEDQSVRDAAIFALSRRSDDEAVPVLMELARTAREAATRRTAMFWLAQSDDPRVPSFFERIILGSGGR